MLIFLSGPLTTPKELQQQRPINKPESDNTCGRGLQVMVSWIIYQQFPCTALFMIIQISDEIIFNISCSTYRTKLSTTVGEVCLQCSSKSDVKWMTLNCRAIANSAELDSQTNDRSRTSIHCDVSSQSEPFDCC